MLSTFKQIFITVIGFCLVFLGLVFIVLPGPAVLFLPVGLALLSLHYDWAKVWLKRCQKLMRASAVKLDQLVQRMKYRRQR